MQEGEETVQTAGREQQRIRELEVSRSGYYEWRGRKPFQRELGNQELLRALVELHEKYPPLGWMSPDAFHAALTAPRAA